MCTKRGHLGKDCRDNYFNQTRDKGEEQKKQSFFSQEVDKCGNIEKGIIDPGCPDSIVGNM